MIGVLGNPLLPAAEKFVNELREVLGRGTPEPDRWELCRDFLRELISDPELKYQAAGWPVTGYNPETNRVGNLLFYEDPDYHFVINALIKKPGGYAMIHDHGKAWTIYGILEGAERIVHYEAEHRDGVFDLQETHSEVCGPGDVDIVPPWLIHSEYTQESKSIAVIVRSQRSGTFEQFRYFEDGRKIEISGPEQIFYNLSSRAVSS